MKIPMQMGGVLDNATSTTSGLTCHSDMTIDDGGYCKAGKLVVVNIRLKVKTGKTIPVSDSTQFIFGLPQPEVGANHIAVNSTRNTLLNNIYLRSDGIIIGSLTTALSSESIVMLSCVYISR